MFLDELMPIATDLMRQPVAFLGGFCAGLFRLNLAEDPVRSWLDQQTGTASMTSHSTSTNGANNKPQSINIE